MLAVVPARLASTRLPRKMLLAETGRCLFAHTAERAASCAAVGRVVVATDAEEVLRAAEAAGLDAVMTSEHHPSGTDRVREAHDRLVERGEGPFDVVVNVQGDEPELPSEDLARLVAAFADPSVEAATLAAPLTCPEEAVDPSVVKVVCDAAGDALYFSRATIPAPPPGGDPAAGWQALRRHVGTYAYRPHALAEFCALGPSDLERAERLEQLRWLEAGRRFRVVRAAAAPPGIDTPEHYAAFVRRTRAGTSPETSTRPAVGADRIPSSS